jgi:hypothetical protein
MLPFLRDPVKHPKPIVHTQQHIELSAADAKRYGCGRLLKRAVNEMGTVERLAPSYYRIDGGKEPTPRYERVRYGFITFKQQQAVVLSRFAGRWEFYEVKVSKK